MLKDVYFISMEGRKNFSIGNFIVDENIALPIYVENKKGISQEDITPENIIKGMINVLTDDPENEHLDYYRKFIFAVKPDIIENLSRVAYEAEKNDNYTVAIDIFKILYILSNNSDEQLLNLAVCHDEYSQVLLSEGNESEADRYEELSYQFYKKIEEIENKSENMLFYLGRFYLIKENYEKAIEFFRSFVEIAKDQERKKEVLLLLNDIFEGGYIDDDYNTALGLIQADKDEQAFEFIEKFITKYPKSWHGYFIKGIALRKTSKFTEALSLFEKSMDLNPDSADINNEIGLCYLGLNIFTKAEMHFFRALKNNPEDINVMFNLAMLNIKKGNKEEALKYCNIILDLNPSDIKVKDLKKQIENQSK